jgi:hypothetical protein
VFLILVGASVGFGIVLRESFFPLMHFAVALVWMTAVAAFFLAATPAVRGFLRQLMKG